MNADRLRSTVRGVGACLPPRVITNAEMATIVDTTDEWIVQRTGIRQRHIAGDGETTSTLATRAAEAALADAGLKPADIDLIIVATSSPDYTFPAVATQVQAALGITTRRRLRSAGGMLRLRLRRRDGRQVSRLRLAQARAGDRRRDLLAPARLDRPHDLRAVRRRGGGDRARGGGERRQADVAGIISAQLRSDGRHREKLYVDGGPSTTKTVGHLRMEGREVFKHAVGMVTDVIKACFDDAGVTAADIDWFVPHQANRRIIDASADKLGLAREKVVVTVDRHGNTSAASIPLALDVAVKDGRIKKGDLVMIEAMGGGFTWGAALIRW